ncbi:MAG: hypothetical protein FWC27_03405 [Firmicutes bacterium]|nr:hypothetical protein [Bacillota bacterium]
MKKSKIVFALVLTLALCLSGIVTVFAADPPSPVGTIGTATAPAQAAITKLLKTPVGTAIPNAKFEFKVTSVTVDGKAADETNMPIIGTPVNGEAAGIITLNPFAGNKTVQTENGIWTIPMESTDIFAGAMGKWTHAGVYVYTVEEIPNTYTIAPANAAHETMNYSPGVYTLNVYVKEGTGANEGVYYIYLIGAMVTTKDDDSQDTTVKINVTPGGGDDANLEYSQMTFTNRYVHTNGGPDPTDPHDATLTVSKKVEGPYGSKEFLFPFELTIHNPDITVDPPLKGSYKAYVVAGSQIVTSTENGAETGENFIVFPSDGQSAKEFKLKDGQSLVFIDTPVGTTYDVREIGTTGYEAELRITSNGTEQKPYIVGPTLGADVSADGRQVGELANAAAVINTRKDVTPTGLNLNDIPFIGLIALALSAVAFFAVIKIRRAKAIAKVNQSL